MRRDRTTLLDMEEPDEAPDLQLLSGGAGARLLSVLGQLSRHMGPDSRFTVGDYERAVARAHASVLGQNNPGRWDNWLDQHIGLETLFLDTEVPAKRLYDRMVEDLRQDGSPYAVRETGVSVNVYATNPSTMTFEYTCHTEVRFTNLCLCDEWNNKEYYLNHSGLTDCVPDSR